MTFREKFMADHAELPRKEAEKIMLAACPFSFGYEDLHKRCPVADKLLTDCAECWNRESN